MIKARWCYSIPVKTALTPFDSDADDVFNQFWRFALTILCENTHQNPIGIALLWFVLLFVCDFKAHEILRYFWLLYTDAKNTHLLHKFVFFVLFLCSWRTFFSFAEPITYRADAIWCLSIDVSRKCSRINMEKANQFFGVFVLCLSKRSP